MRRQRKQDRERRPLPRMALDLDTAVVAIDDPFGQAEPEPDAFNPCRSGRIGTKEAFETLRHQLGLDADAGIAHGETRVLLVARYPYGDDPRSWGELDGVIDQVEDQPLQPARIPLDDDGHAGRLEPERDPFLLRDRLERIDERG